MSRFFRVDSVPPEEQAALQRYASLVTCTYVGKPGTRDYHVLIHNARRNSVPCHLQPAGCQNGEASVAPPRLCLILSNGVHVHQYECHKTLRRELRLLEPVVEVKENVQK